MMVRDVLMHTYLRWAGRQRQIVSIISEHWEIVEACGVLAEWLVSSRETIGETLERTGRKRSSLDDSNARREG